MVKVWRFILLVWTSATIAIAVQNKGVATSYMECSYDEKALTQGKTSQEKAEAYYLAAHYDLTRHDCFSTKIIEYFTKAIDFNPGSIKTYTSYSYRGKVYESIGEKQKALADYTKAIAIAPNVPIAYINRGELYEELGEHQKALDDHTKAIQVDSNSAPAYVARGKTLERLDRDKEALVDYNEAIAKQPYWLDAHVARGNLHQKLDKYQNAIDDYTKAIDLIDNFIEAYLDRRDTIIKTNGLGYTLAKAYRRRGDIYREIGQYQKAIEDFSESSFLQPLPSEFYLSRADIYRELKDYQKALNDYTTVKVRRNDEPIESAKAHLGIGYIYRDTQNLLEAIDSFKQAAYLFKQQGNKEQYQTTLDEIDKIKYIFDKF